MRKSLKILVSVLLITVLSAVPAFAAEVVTSEASEAESEYVVEAIPSYSEEETDNFESELSSAIAEETETVSEEESTIEPEAPTTELYTFEDTTEETEETDNESSVSYTTIGISGLTIPYTLTMKNTDTGDKYTYTLDSSNNWTFTFDGPEGTYKLKLKNSSKSVKAGKIYDSDKKQISTIEIKRTEGWQQLSLSTSEHTTFAVFAIIKEHWFILSALVILGIVYIYLRRHRVLPSQER